ncbi:hypothetical protein B0H17DRAFT_1212031 [Mycena rosella]|uniref:Uncharacterized protein n=1 Tax=Mycena rosella TaxID=1033263 RepID=A0AAD7G3F8_MYCRO|nr:hypothetical protein B0H17DRAFT_1212031 [Mycena rosella]
MSFGTTTRAKMLLIVRVNLGWIDVMLFVLTRNTLIVRRTRTASTNMRSGINVTTHQTMFVDLDPADSQYELQQRSPHGQLKAETDHQPFDGKKTTDAREMDAAGMFRVKVFDGQV